MCACAHVCVCACNGGGTGTVVVLRGPAVFIAQPVTGGRTRVRFALVTRSFAHLCRRRDLDLPHHRRSVGCPNWAHERDRRRRRHLRHRRLRRQRHLPQRRLGEHQRRCGRDSRRGYSTGTRWYSRYSGVAARVPRDYLRGTPMVLPGYCTHARGRNPRGALAHSKGTLRGTICRGGLGAYYTAGHSMGSSAHSRGFKAVLRGYSRGTQGVR
jgi:hypothetical protein